MTAQAFLRAARAQAALKLNDELLGKVGEICGDPEQGSFFAVGSLEVALVESSRVIEELIAELAGNPKPATAGSKSWTQHHQAPHPLAQ